MVAQDDVLKFSICGICWFLTRLRTEIAWLGYVSENSPTHRRPQIFIYSGVERALIHNPGCFSLKESWKDRVGGNPWMETFDGKFLCHAWLRTFHMSRAKVLLSANYSQNDVILLMRDTSLWFSINFEILGLSAIECLPLTGVGIQNLSNKYLCMSLQSVTDSWIRTSLTYGASLWWDGYCLSRSSRKDLISYIFVCMLKGKPE